MSIAKEIINGAHDEELEEIYEAVIRRKKVRGRMQFSSLPIGSRVRFVQIIKPTYLGGMEGTIVGKKVSKLIVRLDAPVGRFRGDIRVPPQLVEPLEIIDTPGLMKRVGSS